MQAVADIATEKPLKLNLGAGTARRPDDHLALDCNPTTNPDILWRAPDHLPFEESTVDAIYTSHFLEHLKDEDVITLMGDIYRVLKPHATVYAVVPYAFSHAFVQDPTHKSAWVPEKFLYFTPHFFVLKNDWEQRFQMKSWSLTKEEVTAVLEKGDVGMPCSCPVCAGNGPPETRRSRWAKE